MNTQTTQAFVNLAKMISDHNKVKHLQREKDYVEVEYSQKDKKDLFGQIYIS